MDSSLILQFVILTSSLRTKTAAFLAPEENRNSFFGSHFTTTNFFTPVNCPAVNRYRYTPLVSWLASNSTVL